MIGYLGSKKVQLNKINKDDHGRILIVDANIDDQNFVLINFYNANTEPEQMNTIPAGIYLLKVNNRSTRARCEICSKLTIKTPERSFWCLYC